LVCGSGFKIRSKHTYIKATIRQRGKSNVGGATKRTQGVVEIYDQPDDGLEKQPKHVVVPKIRYVNKAP